MTENDKPKDELLAKGLAMMDEVYGPGVSDMTAMVADYPYPGETVRHLFGEIWNRPHLSIRDRRLLVLGATAMLGRPDLVEVQVRWTTTSWKKWLCNWPFMLVGAIPPRSGKVSRKPRKKSLRSVLPRQKPEAER